MRLLPLLFLTALAACSDAPPALAPTDAAEQDSVLALLRAADMSAFDVAYARLADRTYRVTTQTMQLDANGEATAAHTRTYRVSPASTRLIDADSSGAFDFGGFGRFADRSGSAPTFGGNPATLVLDEDPAYLDPRGAEVFSFALVGDTLLAGRRVRVLSVRARPGEDDQPLRAARLYVDRDGALVGIRIARRQASLLFEESNTSALFLQPAPEGWVPDRLTSEATIKAPLTDARRFRLDERITLPE